MSIPDLYTTEASSLLREIIAIPSYSSQEEKVADHIESYLKEKGVSVRREKNNIISSYHGFDPNKSSLLLNSHIDTVRDSDGYTFDPFNPPYNEEIIFGLGSNDAGASVVSMIQTFIHFKDIELPFNLILILSAQEECSGKDGIESLSEFTNSLSCAVIGEPTGMKAAIAERGLLVIDAVATGKSGHAARNEGINAIYIALNDVEKIKKFNLPKISPTMGELKFTVTQIEAGSQHNVIPDRCKFTIDIRTTEQYSNSEIVDILQQQTESKLTARNLKNRSSATPVDHPLYHTVQKCGIEKFVSPTTSDWMRLNIPAIKMGPGDSARSHQADEYILIAEIENGIAGYIKFIENLNKIE